MRLSIETMLAYRVYSIHQPPTNLTSLPNIFDNIHRDEHNEIQGNPRRTANNHQPLPEVMFSTR